MKKALLLLYILLMPVLVFSQETGRIIGTVKDASTGDPLPGVNIILKGTYFGAATDMDGKYTVTGVTVGSFNLQASLIGYKTVQYTNIQVNAGKSTQLDILLEETVLTMDQDVVVVGDKPLVDVEETQSKRTIGRDDIEVAVVENVGDVVKQQAGIVENNKSIHIRGGRSYENAFLLDGVSVQDPLAGTGFGLQLSANAVEEVEVITGGFNAEYGQATSGVVNVKTRGGTEEFHGAISYKRDNLGDKSSSHVFDIDILEANLSGPEPITEILLPAFGLDLPGKLSFFTTFYSSLSNGITQGYNKSTANRIESSIFEGTRFAPRQENNYFWLAKLNYNITPTMQLVYSFNQSVDINQNSQSLQSNLEYVEPSPGYQYTFQENLDSANTFTHNNRFNSIGWTHTLNSSLFYELKLSHFFSRFRADANGKIWSDYNESKDVTSLPITYFNEEGDTVGIIPGDGFYDVGNPSTWRDHHVEKISIKGDLTSFFDEKNKFKAGFVMNFSEYQVVDVYRPWIGEFGLNNDIYLAHPADGAFYAQDNINFSGMILNFGVRVDYWFPGKFVDDAVDNPDVVVIPDETREGYKNDTYSLFGRRFKARVSPRLGISHPVTENQILFFSYGHFSKWPRPEYVYTKLNPATAASTFQRFGNPNLDPETTVAYELGLKTQFTNDDVLTVTAYYKDIFDYVRTRTAKISSARFTTQNFITYANLDYARSRGLELEYKKRIGKWFTGMFTFSYAIVTGKSSSADEGVLILRGELDESIKEEFVSWDRPFTVSASTNFYLPKGEGLFGFAPGILDDMNLYLRAFFQSGKRYTPAVFTGTYDSDGRPEYISDRTNRYSEVGDNWFWIDLNFEKYIQVGDMKFTFLFEVNNLLDTKNSAIINPVTGEAYEYGDPTPSSWNDPLYPDLQAPISPYPYNPARYLTRRNIKFGIGFKF